MERLKNMRETLTACVEKQLCHLDQVDTQELGAVVDMIKDLEEAIYYCTITKAMNEPQQKGMMQQQQHMQQGHYQEEPKYNSTMYMNDNGRMYRAYYGDNPMHTNGSPASYMDGQGMMNNDAGGRSPKYRTMYMNGKASHHNHEQSMKELEEYVHELTEDIMEMIEEASPEEKQLLRQKINILSTKIK